MNGQVSVNGAVEVLLDRGTGYSPRWTVGSGFLIGGTRVLTAAHNVGEGEFSVRVRRGTEYTATIAQVGDVDQGLDLAIVNITDPSFRDVPEAMVQFAKLNRDSPDLLQGCWAIGFPRFKEKDLAPSGRRRLRDTAQVKGEIPLAANLISDMLELNVTATPQASPYLGSSEWEGMSGAVVFCKDPVHGNRAIGVIVEHYQPEGISSLTVVPITAINKLDEPTARKWWNLLGVVDHRGLPHLPPEPHSELVAAEARYREQVINKYQSLDFGGFARSDLLLKNVPLEKIFVRLSLTVEKVIREPVLSEDSSQAGRRQRRPQEPKTVQEPIELGQALGKHVLIVGEPGAGKSTLLHWLAVTFAQGTQREPNRVGPLADTDRLPILVDLGKLPARYLAGDGETPNWFTLLPEYLPTQQDFTGTPAQLFTSSIDKGRCLLLFDGLDEIADRQARARIARSLADLARLSPGNRVIIGSRPAGVIESEGMLRLQFQRCQIEHFRPEEIQRFFHFWYALDDELTAEQQREEADELFARVQVTPQVLRLATTPLLSTILLLIWRNEGGLRERRVELYEQCCRMLIEQWELHHEVKYQGILAKKGWKDHLNLLAPLAYTIHSQEQRTSATRDELMPLLSKAVQTAGYANTQADADQEAKDFLDTLGLRSGLLQYMGNDQYGFPHQTFQEYLAARYIAAQPDPDYIDLVMAHLHESGWQEVHLLTIAHLGSGKAGASKASALILAILHVYTPPSWILRSSGNRWLRLIGPGKLVPQMQLERRIAWILAREFELAVKGYVECKLDGTTVEVSTVLSAQAASIVRSILYDSYRSLEQVSLLTVACQLLQRKGNKAVMSDLLEALHDVHKVVRASAAEILGQVGADNEAVIIALLETALHDADRNVRELAAASLGQVGVGNEAVVSALLEALHDRDGDVRRSAAASLGQVGVGNEAVVSALLEALHDANWDVRASAAASLGQVGVGNEAVVSALLEALHDRDGDVRRSAAAILGQMGVGNEAVVSVLLEALHEISWGVPESAAAILGQAGAGNRAVSVLLEALRNGGEARRERAAAILGQVGAGNEAVVSALLEALHDIDIFVRMSAAESLWQMGVSNEAVVSAVLKAALYSVDIFVRMSAAASLRQMGVSNEAMVSALLEALHDREGYVRERAAASLGQMGVSNEAVVSVLLEALHDANWDVRASAAASLGQAGAGNEAVVSALLEALHDRDGDVRASAAASLGRLEIKDMIQLRQLLVVLNSCLHDWDNNVRQAALESIRQQLDGRPIPGYQ